MLTHRRDGLASSARQAYRDVSYIKDLAVIDYLQAGLFWSLTLVFLFRFAPRSQGRFGTKTMR